MIQSRIAKWVNETLGAESLENTPDDGAISALVREWALEHGDDPDLRIALCGYDGEHDMPASWQVHAWKAARGYAKADNDNRSKERIWFSPACLPLEGNAQRSLFEVPT